MGFPDEPLWLVAGSRIFLLVESSMSWPLLAECPRLWVSAAPAFETGWRSQLNTYGKLAVGHDDNIRLRDQRTSNGFGRGEWQRLRSTGGRKVKKFDGQSFEVALANSICISRLAPLRSGLFKVPANLHSELMAHRRKLGARQKVNTGKE